MRSYLWSKVATLVLFGCLALLTSGCIQFNTDIDITPGGSGNITMQVGLSHQIAALAGTAEFEQEVQENLGGNGEVEFSTWSDDTYYWVEARRQFASLEELNQLLDRSGAFREIEIRQERDLFVTTYIISGVVNLSEAEAPPEELNESNIPFNFDPDQFMNLALRVTLPGKVTSSNASSTDIETNTLTWRLASSGATTISARSEAVDWLTVTIVAICLGVLLLLAFAFLLWTIFRPRQKLAQQG